MFVGLRGLLCQQIFILNIISVSDPKNIIQHDYQNANLHGNIAKLYANALQQTQKDCLRHIVPKSQVGIIRVRVICQGIATHFAFMWWHSFFWAHWKKRCLLSARISKLTSKCVCIKHLASNIMRCSLHLWQAYWCCMVIVNVIVTTRRKGLHSSVFTQFTSYFQWESTCQSMHKGIFFVIKFNCIVWRIFKVRYYRAEVCYLLV